VAASLADTRLDLRESLQTFVVISTLALLGFGVVVTILRRLTQHSQDLAARTVDVNEKLAQEIKQRVFAEEQAIAAQKLESLGLLAGGIAHDFNNLLVSILGHLELARLPQNTDESVDRHLSLVQDACERAKNLIKQMLTYVGKQPIELRAIDLTHSVEQMAPFLVTSAGRTAHLIFETEPNLPTFLGDSVQIEQVFLNLVTNAAEAIGDEAGTITIRTGLTEDTSEVEQLITSAASQIQTDEPVVRVFLEVEDTGCGLTAGARKRMLDPFFSTKGHGRGLGLASIQGIARAHNGAIMIASDEGEGTLFRVEFPVYDSDVPKSSGVEAIKVELNGHGRTVLVVDDDDSARTTTTDLLRAHQFVVESADSGMEAIEYCQRAGATIDAVVLDMSMPVMSGVETHARIKQILPDVLVVFVSGFLVDERTHGLVHGGHALFVQKPFSGEQLIRAILIGRAHPGEAKV
jgi:signal transduction histidine kinase/ActR/RegA family two-component response regulator